MFYREGSIAKGISAGNDVESGSREAFRYIVSLVSD